jgi:fibronectin-binding autotransporter adhesin
MLTPPLSARKRKLMCRLGSIAALTVVAGAVHAQTITNPGYYPITGSSTWGPNWYVQNFGGYSVGTIDVTPGANLNVAGAGYLLGGTFENRGSVNISASGAYRPTDYFEAETFENAGAINVTGSNAAVDLYGVTNVNSGSINVGGTGNYVTVGSYASDMTITSTGSVCTSGSTNSTVLYTNGGGGFLNQGTITGANYSSTLLFSYPGDDTFTNSGTVQAESGGGISIHPYGYDEGTVSINDGTYISSGNGVTSTLIDFSGKIVNNGTMEAIGTHAGSQMPYLNLGNYYTGSQICNNGVLLASHGTLLTNFFVNAGSMTNFNQISLQNGSGYLDVSQRFVNNGTIQADGGSSLTLVRDGGQFINRGSISFTNASVLRVYADSAANSGTISIDATSSGYFANGLTQLGSAAVTTVDGTLTMGGSSSLVLGDGSSGDGGLLTGSGTIVGNVDNESGTVSMGDPHTLTVDGNFIQGKNGVLDFQIAGDAGPGLANGYDQLDVIGNLTLEGTIDLTFIDGYIFNPEDGLDLFAYGGSLDIVGNVKVVNAEDPEQFFLLTQNANGSGGSLSLKPVPAPGASLPLALGLGKLLLRNSGKRRRQRFKVLS